MPDLRLRFHKDMLVVAPLLTPRLFGADTDASDCQEYLNILDDDLVRDTYQRFRLAGAQCAPSNTLKAHRAGLAAFGLENALVDVNRAGVKLAREAGIEHVFAALELQAPEQLLEQLLALLSADPDAILLVGEGNDPGLSAAIAAIRTHTSLPIAAPVSWEPVQTAVGEDAATADARRATAGDSTAAGGAQGADEHNVSAANNADICYTMGGGFAESLRALERRAEGSAQGEPEQESPIPMVCPQIPLPTYHNEAQRMQAQNHAADETVDFALAAREKGAQFLGTAPGSSPIFTGALFAAIGGMDCIAPKE